MTGELLKSSPHPAWSQCREREPCPFLLPLNSSLAAQQAGLALVLLCSQDNGERHGEGKDGWGWGESISLSRTGKGENIFTCF